MKRLYILLLSLLVTVSVIAQPVCQVKHFSVNDGLAQGNVMGMLQDRNGLIWFSTWNGLSKYDGYTFKTYKTSQEDRYAFGSNRMGTIMESKYGDIWCPTYDGQACLFDVETEKFIDVLQPLEYATKHSNHVVRIQSLKKGVAWIICENGYTYRADEQLCKKGEGITQYSTFTQNLKGEHIFTVYQDSDEDEWILTNKGVTIVGSKAVDTDFPFQYITQIKENIYLVADKGKLAQYNFRTKKLKFINIPCPHNRINTIAALGTDTLALGTDNGLILFSAHDNMFRQIDIRTSTQPSNYVEQIYQDRQKDVWVFPRNPGIVRLHLNSNEKEHLFTPQNEVIKHGRNSRKLIFEDKTGILWVLPTGGNLSYYDRKEKKLKPLLTDIDKPKSIFSPLVRFYTLDTQGNCWLATARGIDRISFFPQSYQFNQTDYEAETRAFLRDSHNRLWSASKASYIQIYAPDGSLEGYLSNQGTIVKEKQIFHNGVYAIMEDKEKNIWLGTKGAGLFLLTPKSLNQYSITHFKHRSEDPYSISDNSIYSIFQDSRNRIWIGCYGGGLNLFTPGSNGSPIFIHSNNELKNYPTDYGMKVRNITEVSGGVILVGTTDGLLTFSNKFELPEEVKFYRNCHKPGDKNSLITNDIMQIYTDKQKATYVVSFTGGISKIISTRLLSEEIRFKNYDKSNGLASDLTLSMIEDTYSQLWIVSEIALSKFDTAKETFENYTLGSTYQQQFNFSEALPVINARQQVVLGTDKGFLEITPGKMRKSAYVPPIVFTGFKIQGTSQNLDINDLKELRLKPSERNVTFQFAALDYVAPESISYAYRLKGLEEKWNEVDNSRSASYINLPPGEYELQIRSTNSDGVWMEKARILPITVLPTFWETYWAWILYVVLFVLSTATIVYIILYIYRLRHQINIEQQLANIKLRFFTDISHELRTPLTLIASPVTEVLEHETLTANARKHLTLVHKNTERMLHLVNQILDFRKIENKKMKVLLEKTDVLSLLQKVMDNFRLIAEEKNINYQLETNQEAIETWIDQDKFEKIIFNLLSNAFKYTPANKSITVIANVESSRLIVSIKDEGIGIDLQKQQTLFQRFETLVKFNILQPSSGIGLSLVKELIELHCGNIEVKSQPGVGSEFTVILPMNQKVYEGRENTEFILNDGNSVPAEKKNEIRPMVEIASMADITLSETANEPNQISNEEDPISILIVEDNVELRNFLSDILSESYRVITATNGQEGLDQAREYIPDLIISDIMMPAMDGLDMVKNIKENREICHIPIILLSAKSSLDDRISGLEQGIDDYITKPFSATYLKIRIKSLLHQRKELQEIYWKAWSEKLNNTQETTLEEKLTPSQPQIISYDEQFMQQVMQVMEEQMENSELTVDEFAQLLNLGRSVFYQKLKSIIGLSPVDFIREIRIKRAVQLIDSGEYNFSQVAYMTGFNDPKYFGKCFKRQMGMTPSEYKENKLRTPL